ncbi:MAG TPA: DJ-1/PfpI family protein [Puia sp.]|nr:DJ-1/PfpI family protein [Puia sp.]
MPGTGKIVFFVPPGVHMLDMSGPSQAFLAAGQLLSGYPIRYCSFRPEIADSTGLKLCSLAHYASIALSPADHLFIPGFSSALLLSDSDKNAWEGVYQWLRNAASAGVRICAVCTGAFVLAKAGLLDGRSCTTHWAFVPLMRRQFPRIAVKEDVLFVQDSTIYTSAGISSGIDLALHLLETDHGPLLAHKVAHELVVYFRRSDSHSQLSVYLDYRNHLHPGIHRLQDWLIEHLDRKMTIDDMARMVNMSSRNLTRTFKHQTGISINRYLTLLRLELADNLRHSPGMTMREIACRCGFSNERQLQRILKAATPRRPPVCLAR